MSKIAYFDNAATTFPKPQCAYDFADAFYRHAGGNIGRGGNALAAAAGDIAQQAKDNLRTLYCCPANEVVFTSSATDALNRILLGLGLGAGDNVFISPFEHNAVTRPLNHLAKESDINLHVLNFDKTTLLPDYSAIEQAFCKNPPRLVVLTHASNVCGAVIPVEEICRIAKRFEANTVIDMSQTAGLLPLDLASDLYDFAVFAGHKTLLGPFGIGGFFCKRGRRLNPVFFGGNGINSIEQDLPSNIVQMEEIASQNTYAIAGLKASTDWIIERGWEATNREESAMSERLLGLLRSFSNVSIVGDGMSCGRIGVVSALFDGYSPDEVELILGNTGVAVRSGLHCAPYAHRFLDTLPAGTVRFSVSALTDEDDFARLENALQLIRDEG